jgi:hypothetical protein
MSCTADLFEFRLFFHTDGLLFDAPEVESATGRRFGKVGHLTLKVYVFAPVGIGAQQGLPPLSLAGISESHRVVSLLPFYLSLSIF